MAKKRKFTEGLFDKAFVIEQLQLKEGQSVLDAGCGNGYMAKEFAQGVGDAGKVYAMDIEEYGVRQLQEEVKKSNIIPLVGDITRPCPLEKGSLDLVYLATVYHIFSVSQERGFALEVKRILRPGGLLGVLNMIKEPLSFGPPVEMKCSPEELREKIDMPVLKCIPVERYFYLQLFINN